MVCSCNTHGSHDGEGICSRIKKFGVKNRGVIDEKFRIIESADNEDFAVGENDAVVQSTSIMRVCDGGDGWFGVGCTEGDDVGV